jgi:uncharacterized protein
MSKEEFSSDERTMALLAHLSAFVLAIIGPAILLVAKGKESKFVEYHAKQALIVQSTTLAIALGIYFISCGLCFPVLLLPFATGIYGIFVGLKANEGEWAGYIGIDHIGRPTDLIE